MLPFPKGRLWEFFSFTLLELLVTVVILSVMAGLLLGGVRGVRTKADAVACLHHLRQLGLAFHLYAEANGGFLPYPNAAYGGDQAEYCWFNALDPHLSGACAATNQTSERMHFLKHDPIIKRLGDLWLTNAHTLKMNEWISYTKDGAGVDDVFWTLSDFPLPALSVLLFDGKAETSKNADGTPGAVARQPQGTEGDVMRRHSDRANVLFVDGHAESREEKRQTSGDRLGWKVNATRLIWKPWTNLVTN